MVYTVVTTVIIKLNAENTIGTMLSTVGESFTARMDPAHTPAEIKTLMKGPSTEPIKNLIATCRSSGSKKVRGSTMNSRTSSRDTFSGACFSSTCDVRAHPPPEENLSEPDLERLPRSKEQQPSKIGASNAQLTTMAIKVLALMPSPAVTSETGACVTFTVGEGVGERLGLVLVGLVEGFALVGRWVGLEVGEREGFELTGLVEGLLVVGLVVGKRVGL